MNQSKNLTGIILVAVSASCYGFMPIFAKLAYAAGTSTYTLLFLRFLIASAFMFVIMGIKKIPMPSVKEMISFLMLGALGYVGQSFCYFVALNYASSSTVSLLFYTNPAMVLIGSALVLKEKITTKKLISLCFALCGAFVIIGGEFDADMTGLILAVLSALFYSIYLLVASKVVKPGMGTQSSAFIMLGAAIVYAVVTMFVGFVPPAETIGYAAVVMIALVSTVGAFWTFFAGMEKTGPTVASLVSTLEPVVTVVASVVILSEPVTVNLIIGGCLVVASLIVTILPTKH
ncbi:MAG: EamA/RhaT family transporter [Lachnoclostridium sp.]|nr:EamA/RhaT family transporter [Lachnoclostridium sp.]